MKILVVVGTRPEAIKMAPVVRALWARPHHQVLVASSAQHGVMLDEQLQDRGIVPDLALARSQHPLSGTLTGLTAAMLLGAGFLIDEAKPDLVLVQGDTTTAVCGALAAFYRGIPVGHVEAGLRTDNVREPFPEELNRRLIAQVATLHFAPTKTASNNLWGELGGGHVWVTGNTVVDELKRMVTEIPVVAHLGPDILVTCHRREAMDERLGALIRGIAELARSRPEAVILWPLHANPVIVEAVSVGLMGLDNVRLENHLPYSAFVSYLRNAALVITDSGGVIEEATTLGRRLLIIRDDTERPEALTTGSAWLVKMKDMPRLPTLARQALEQLPEREWSTVFGLGDAGESIAMKIDWWASSRG